MKRMLSFAIFLLCTCLIIFMVYYQNNVVKEDASVTQAESFSSGLPSLPSSAESVTEQESSSAMTEEQKVVYANRSLNKPMLSQLLQNSVFENYSDYKDLSLEKNAADLCFSVQVQYNLYLSTQGLKQNNVLSNDLNDSFLLTNKEEKRITSGLFCYQDIPGSFELILIEFNKGKNISGSYLGSFTLENKDNIDVSVKRQQAKREKVETVAKTFGIDLTQYVPASSKYDTAYGDAQLTFLREVLRKSLNSHSTENIDNQGISYYLNKDLTGGVVLNSGDNGMQYCHKFLVIPGQVGAAKFQFVSSESKYYEPISQVQK